VPTDIRINDYEDRGVQEEYRLNGCVRDVEIRSGNDVLAAASFGELG